ncbi:cell division protein SepF [Curtobacterium sp. MCBA15_007]|uniref:cell division protein SepF n=1 Tax=Curtobacterium TaxID=2034 RepID=UPI0008DE4C5A|nr:MULTISPECIES: cell division protein SepF [Curtobacterium]MCS6575518.1 cell division protein SepF [Curtobacterium flaccumfaciens pv. flaccumfaciens]OII06714.1 cell division protein SepF [Curtobacterium sp. MCBA15_007]
MANPLKKTMVYLGLADEELDYEDEQQAEPARQQAAPARQAAAAAPAVAEPQETPAAAAAPVAVPAAVPAPTKTHTHQRGAQVTPLRRSHTTAQKATPVQEMNEILTVHPREYKDAQSIAESFRDGIPVIINLSQMTEGDARRMIDFASGLSLGLFGKIERVTNKVFLLSPAHVAVSGEPAEVESDIEANFFAQS